MLLQHADDLFLRKPPVFIDESLLHRLQPILEGRSNRPRLTFIKGCLCLSRVLFRTDADTNALAYTDIEIRTHRGMGGGGVLR
jgi:hypothetical protein